MLNRYMVVYDGIAGPEKDKFPDQEINLLQ